MRPYVDAQRQVHVLNAEPPQVKTTGEVREGLTSYVGGYQLRRQLPEAYATDGHLIVLGDSRGSRIAAALQAAEVVPQIAAAKYPGPRRALISFVRSPFAVGKDVVLTKTAGRWRPGEGG